MIQDKPTFNQACRDLRKAFPQVVNIYARALPMLLPPLLILLKFTARVVFYVPEKWYLRLIYALIVATAATGGIAIVAHALRWI